MVSLMPLPDLTIILATLCWSSNADALGPSSAANTTFTPKSTSIFTIMGFESDVQLKNRGEREATSCRTF